MSQIQQQALANAVGSLSMSNYPAIFAGFEARGIPENEIQPRENVFTYHAWRALGRQVRKGEHGVKVVTWITCKTKQTSDNDEPGTYRRPKSTTVFHVSQTDEIKTEAA